MLLAPLIAVLIVAVFAAGVFYYHRQKKQNEERELEQNWGKLKSGSFFFEQICRHAAATKTVETNQLNDQTLNDSNFYDLFRFLDRTVSKPGQQYFFTKLIRPHQRVDDLLEFDERVQYLAADPKSRLAIQKELRRLSGSESYLLTALFQEQLLQKPDWYALAIGNVAVTVISLIVSFAYPAALLIALLSLVLSFLIHYWSKTSMVLHAKSLPQLGILIATAKKLLPLMPCSNRGEIENSISELAPLQTNISLLGYGGTGDVKDDLNQIAGYAIELLKGIFLFEFFLLFKVVDTVAEKRQNVSVLFSFIGETDSAVSVASLREGSYPTCKPEFRNGSKDLFASGLYHPLVERCVKNDFSTNGRSALISGSNMSGKTTFIRTVLINSILAQTIYTCFAETFKSPFYYHSSSIVIDDGLLDGNSYYMQEVSIIRSLVKEVETGRQNLYILDEVFKGTNSLERISAAKAVLSYLNRFDNLVLVSTHDLELGRLLGEEYEQYHFTEVVTGEGLSFDHRLKNGPLTTRNAIRVLEISEYPREIIGDAKAVAASLLEQNHSHILP